MARASKRKPVRSEAVKLQDEPLVIGKGNPTVAVLLHGEVIEGKAKIPVAVPTVIISAIPLLVSGRGFVIEQPHWKLPAGFQYTIAKLPDAGSVTGAEGKSYHPVTKDMLPGNNEAEGVVLHYAKPLQKNIPLAFEKRYTGIVVSGQLVMDGKVLKAGEGYLYEPDGKVEFSTGTHDVRVVAVY